MELIDTHCHLTFDGLADDIDAVIERSKQAGVVGWITVGTSLEQNEQAVRLADRFENMYAAVGIHPHDAKDVNAETLPKLKQLARSRKVVAVGETGLDYHYNFSSRPDQRRLFAAQLTIAAELNLPVIVHSREAFDDTMDMLDRFRSTSQRIVFHCFTGSADQAKVILGKGYYISFTGAVTFKNAKAIQQAAAIVPTDRLMLETDCPYMSPEPMRKQKINEPALMPHTAACIAQLKGLTPADFAQSVTATSRAFFNLPTPALYQ